MGLMAMRKFLAAIILILLAGVTVLAAPEQPLVKYQAFVQDVGWLNSVQNGETAGTTGKGLRVEAVRIDFSGVQYCTHVQNVGWMGWKNSGEVSGTTDKNLRVEAVRIRLSGKAADDFDIYYRVHVQNGGWLGWAKNGEPAGTAGGGLRMEAMQIQILPKGTAVNQGGKAFYERETRVIPVI